jgi:hypothetical protein
MRPERTRAEELVKKLEQMLADAITAEVQRAVAEERVTIARAISLLERMFSAACVEDCGEYGPGFHGSRCARMNAENDLYGFLLRARQSTGAQECGVKGCTLPPTHGAEPHSWEHPHGDSPDYEPHGEPR